MSSRNPDAEPTAIRGGIKTYSLAEVAAMVLPPEWSDGPRWLARRLNRGQIRGYRVGRVWRMTEAHVEDLIERFTNAAPRRAIRADTTTPPPATVLDALSARSRHRIRRLP